MKKVLLMAAALLLAPLAVSAVIDTSSSSPSLLRAVASTGAAVCWHSLQASLNEPNCLHGSKTILISLWRASTSSMQKTECTCIPHLQQKWFPRVACAGAVQRPWCGVKDGWLDEYKNGRVERYTNGRADNGSVDGWTDFYKWDRKLFRLWNFFLQSQSSRSCL